MTGAPTGEILPRMYFSVYKDLYVQSSGNRRGFRCLLEAGDESETFNFELGKDHVTPGFDEAVAQMKKGEKRVVIVPAELGYGDSGYYAPEKPGQPRFVIPPRTMLVYEIELIDF